MGHSNLHVFDNRTAGFEGKMQRVVDVVGALVGLPQTKKKVFKYLLPHLPNLDELPVKYEVFQV